MESFFSIKKFFRVVLFLFCVSFLGALSFEDAEEALVSSYKCEKVETVFSMSNIKNIEGIEKSALKDEEREIERRAEKNLSALYKGERVEGEPILLEFLKLTEELEEILSQKKHNTKEENAKFALCFDSLRVVYTAYLYGILDFESASRMKKAEKSICKLLKRATPSSEVYLKYADYLYAKIAVSPSVILKLPVLYRKALIKDPNNDEARVKLACFYCFAANEKTGNFNSFIERNEKNLELLDSLVDKLNAYVAYSIYYMKKYNSEKGGAYLEKAKEVLPGNILAELLEANYQKGILSL